MDGPGGLLGARYLEAGFVEDRNIDTTPVI